jgi:hypothetical protein
LARDYFAFLSYLIETYAQKVSVMEGPMLDPIIACLIHGVSLPESDIARKVSLSPPHFFLARSLV